MLYMKMHINMQITAENMYTSRQRHVIWATEVIGMLLHLNQEERPRSAQGLLGLHRPFIHPCTLFCGVKLCSSKAYDRNGDTGSQLNSWIWRPGLNFAPSLICCLILCEVSNTKANKPKPLCAFTQSLVTSHPRCLSPALFPKSMEPRKTNMA